MIKPAPYSPETLTRIRKMALSTGDGEIAAQLGWQRDSLRRIAREHGIELAICDPIPVPPESPAAPESIAHPLKRNERKGMRRASYHEPTWQFRMQLRQSLTDVLRRQAAQHFLSPAGAINEIVAYVERKGLWDEALGSP